MQTKLRNFLYCFVLSDKIQVALLNAMNVSIWSNVLMAKDHTVYGKTRGFQPEGVEKCYITSAVNRKGKLRVDTSVPARRAKGVCQALATTCHTSHWSSVVRLARSTHASAWLARGQVDLSTITHHVFRLVHWRENTGKNPFQSIKISIIW